MAGLGDEFALSSGGYVGAREGPRVTLRFRAFKTGQSVCHWCGGVEGGWRGLGGRPQVWVDCVGLLEPGVAPASWREAEKEARGLAGYKARSQAPGSHLERAGSPGGVCVAGRA